MNRNQRIRTIFIVSCILVWIGSPQSAVAEDILQGDTRLACEAILCLSSNSRPSECKPSLNRYFSIRRDKFSDTLKARKSFLKKCPSASADDNMASLMDAIVNAAGKCTVEELNKRGRYVHSEEYLYNQPCPPGQPDMGDGYSVTYIHMKEAGYCLRVTQYFLVDTTLPNYCSELWDHTYTYFPRPHLKRGQYPWQTRWVE